ncbi:hypothetical protein PZ61_0235985 [Streptomyces sp. MNU77]|nr:hypothetical protein PZ61_0235985 [Streptomyces sp. MNU77]
MPVTKQARSEVSTRRLLDAAQELIGEVGYDRATMALIAERAGYSHGLITRRFGSKENMLYALVERMTLVWGDSEGHVEAAGQTGRDGILAAIDHVLDGHRRSPDSMRGLYVLMFEALNSVSVLRDRLLELHRHFRDSLAAAVRRGIEEGAIDASVQPERVARMLVSGLRGAAYQWLLDPDGVDFGAALTDLRHVLELMLPSPEAA